MSHPLHDPRPTPARPAVDAHLSRRTLVSRGVAALAGGAAVFGTSGAAAALTATPAGPALPPAAGDPAAAFARGAITVSPEVLAAGTLAPGLPGREYRPVTVPNGTTLPFRVVDGVKVFHLVAEPVQHEFAPGLTAECWGFNGRTPGPLLEAVEGDRVRVYVTNKLPAPTSVHWHGILLPSGMDGVAGLSQAPIPAGETFKYEFTLRQHGSYMYHSHRDEMTQQALGMMGMFVVHPRDPSRLGGRRADRDFALLSSEWKVTPGTRRPDPNEMLEFNILTWNGKAYPGTAPVVVERDDYVRVRLGNLSAMSHHPIHIHGHAWTLVATDGGPIPPSGQWPETTVLVPVGSTRTMEFVADNPGDWAMHCHMSHHVMNQMGHAGINLVGVDTDALDVSVQKLLPDYMTMGSTGMGEMAEMGMPVPKNSIPMLGAPGPHGYVDMGGMFTILKVRDRVTPESAKGWYRNPPGTVAAAASAAELRRDGIVVG